LAIVSDAPESSSIEVIKYLIEKKANLSAIDFNKNTILHLAVKHNKLEIIKFFQDLFIEFLFIANKEGQTPFAVAQENNNTEILSFLNSILGNSDTQKNIEEDLNELIESVNKQKNRRKKKTKNKGDKDELRLLNSAAFSDTFKIKQPLSKNVVVEESMKSSEVDKIDIVETKIDINKNEKKNNFVEEEFEDKRNIQYKYENNNYEDRYVDENHYNRNANKNYLKQRGYKKNIENYEYGYEYDYSYNQVDNRYDHGYGYENYYNGGRYGKNNFEGNANIGRFKNEREYRYQERDNAAGKKNYQTYEKEVIVEKPIIIEEKDLNQNLKKNSKEKVEYENIENSKNDISRNNNDYKNIDSHTHNSLINDVKKEKKEKKIFGLDEKTLKKIEKKEKRPKPSNASEKRKSLIEETINNQKEELKEKTVYETNKQEILNETPIEKNLSSIVSKDVSPKDKCEIENEKLQKIIEKEIKDYEVKIENNLTNEKIDKKKENVQKINLDKVKVEEIIKEDEIEINKNETKRNNNENRVENIYVNEDLLYSKDLIKNYYV